MAPEAEASQERCVLLLCDRWKQVAEGLHNVNRFIAITLSRFQGVHVYSTTFRYVYVCARACVCVCVHVSFLSYVASVVVRVTSRVIALKPATASSCESWMSSQIWSVQRRGGLPRGRRQEGGADDDRMLMPWVPGGRRHDIMCPKAPRRCLRMVSGCCPVRA